MLLSFDAHIVRADGVSGPDRTVLSDVRWTAFDTGTLVAHA